MESSIETVFIKVEDDENYTENFVCNFCCTNFTTMIERDQHLETHLIRQNCSSCKKPMILIGNQLYELHLPLKCKEEIIVEGGQPVIECENKRETRSASKRHEKKGKPLAENKNSVNTSENIKLEKVFDLAKNTASHKIIVNNVEALNGPVINTDEFTTEVQQPASDSSFIDEAPDDKKTNKKSKTRRENSDVKTEKTYKKKYPKTIPCDMCHEKFGVQKTLIIHQKKVHNKMPVHKCDICGMILKTALYLKNHVAIHLGEKRYICSYCGKRFHVSFRLKEHINQHTGEKPYKCTLCDKSFGRTSLRNVHMRVHTGEKPFKCNFENCDRAYAHTSDLKRHRRSAHGIILKTFECPICSKIFYENKFLTKHLNVHKEQI